MSRPTVPAKRIVLDLSGNIVLLIRTPSNNSYMTVMTPAAESDQGHHIPAQSTHTYLTPSLIADLINSLQEFQKE